MEYTHKPRYIAAMVIADVVFVGTMVLHGLVLGGVSTGKLHEVQVTCTLRTQCAVLIAAIYSECGSQR